MRSCQIKFMDISREEGEVGIQGCNFYGGVSYIGRGNKEIVFDF